jgi:hypothetical protein
MATKTAELLSYLPDGTTPRETYTEIIGLQSVDEIVWGNSLTFSHESMGGFGRCTFTIYKPEADVDTIEGDIIVIKWDSVIRYVGQVIRKQVDLNDENPYSDKIHFTCDNLLNARALHIGYSLIETDAGQVSTTIQNVFTDLFEGGVYTGKGQDNNTTIEANSIISYSAVNNTLPSQNIDVKYDGVPCLDVYRQIINIARGTQDLTIVEPYISYLKTDNTIHTKTRETDSSPIASFDLSTTTFRAYNSDDIDGYHEEHDTDTIINKVIINEVDYSATSQYSTEVSTSQSAYGIREERIKNSDLNTDLVQEWVDGWQLRTLDRQINYFITLKKRQANDAATDYTQNPVWFGGSTDVPDGYIEITGQGKTPATITAPFQRCTYRLTSAGWEQQIIAGDVRPVLDMTGITRQPSEFSSTLTGGVRVFDPSPTDETNTSVPEFKDYVSFEYEYNNTRYKPTTSDVEFIIRITGGDIWSTGGTVVKTLTDSTQPPVTETSSGSGVFRAVSFNGDTAAPSRVVNGTTLYAFGYASGGNDTIYTVECQITVYINGIAHVQPTGRTPFRFVSDTRDSTITDHDTRLPVAEVELLQTWTGGDARFRFYTDESGDAAPDGGDEGWFVTNDDVTWTRMTGDAVVNQTGTTNDSWTIDSDNSAAQYVSLIAENGTLRYDKTNNKWQVEHDTGVGYVDITTTGQDSISKTTATPKLYTCKIDTDGNLVFENTTDTTTLFKISTLGEITTYDYLSPSVDEQDDIGSSTKKYDNIYLTTAAYVDTVVFSDDGGTTVYGKMESDSVNNQVIPINVAIGFMDG